MEQVVFEAAITPYRSLSVAGQRRLLMVLAGLLMLGTGVFAVVGAWPVGGFAGAELLLAMALFRWHGRQARAGELIILTPRVVRVVRTDGRGRRREVVLPVGWVQARIEERDGRSPALVLSLHGRREEIATDLGEAERRDLGRALQEALARLRAPCVGRKEALLF